MILQSRSDKLKSVLKSHQIVTREENKAKTITKGEVETAEVQGMVQGMVHEMGLEMVLPEITLTTQL